MHTNLPSLEGSAPLTSSKKRRNAPDFPPARQQQRDDSRSPPNRPLPALPVQRGASRQRWGARERSHSGAQQRGQRYDSPQQAPNQQGSLRDSSPARPQLSGRHPLSNPLYTQQIQGRNPLIRKSVPASSSPTSMEEQPYYHDKVLPPIPQFDDITMSPEPTRGGATESARGSLMRSLGNVDNMGGERSAVMNVGSNDVSHHEAIGESKREGWGSDMKNRVHALMNDPSGTGLVSRSSFDIRKERDFSTRSRPALARVASEIFRPDGSRASRFTEELVVDDEDVSDFQRWKEMKRLDNQRYDATQAASSNDPRSPLELPSTTMGNITDSVPRRFLRKIASFGSRRASQGEQEPSLSKKESKSSFLRKVTSLDFMRLSEDERKSGGSSASPLTPVRTTIDAPPPVRPQRPARSPLDLHVGRMEFEDSNPFAYVEYRRPMDAFHRLKRWSWYNQPGCRSFNVDPNWDNAKKELDRVEVADDQILSIIADYEDMPGYVELIHEIESELSFRKAREDGGTSSPHMGIDLNNAPMVLRHLEEYGEGLPKPMFETRVLGSIGSGDEVDVPVMLERDYSDDSDDGVGGCSFDCAAALNGQMTFLISDSEDEGVEEEAVIGAYSTHRRYLSGEVVRVWGTDSTEGAFF